MNVANVLPKVAWYSGKGERGGVKEGETMIQILGGKLTCTYFSKRNKKGK